MERADLVGKIDGIEDQMLNIDITSLNPASFTLYTQIINLLSIEPKPDNKQETMISQDNLPDLFERISSLPNSFRDDLMHEDAYNQTTIPKRESILNLIKEI